MDDSKIQELDKRKKYLKQYKKTKALVERLEKKLYSLDERIYSVKSPIVSDMPRGGVPVELVDLLSDKEELEARINRLNQKARRYKIEITDKIDELEDVRYAEILEAFFIDFKTFDEIADEKGYHTRHVIRLYSEAILALPF